jgi:dTDP-4-amino-4,6-dideoxygalactose transaminase
MKNLAPPPYLDRYYFAHQSELDEAFRRVMRRGRYVLGEEVQRFEHEFAAYCGTAYCVGVGNGLDALKLALLAFGLKEGDEVIVPANTFIATFLAVSQVGAVPVPVDPRPDTFNIDAIEIEKAITSHTRAIIVVHLFGQPVDMAPIARLASKYRLRVLEDAAQAHGATFNGRRVGSLGDAAAFSFYPAKNLAAFGDGGAVTTDDRELAESIAQLRNYGSGSKHRHVLPGFNSRLDELQAAFLRVTLKSLDWSNAVRARHAHDYSEAFSEHASWLNLPKVQAGAMPVWHQYVVRCEERDSLQRFLAGRSIQTLVHYPTPPHLQPVYLKPGSRIRLALPLPITERLALDSLSLPVHPYMTHGEQAHVTRAVLDFKAGTRKGRDSTLRSSVVKPSPALPSEPQSQAAHIQAYEHAYLADLGFESLLVESRQKLILEHLKIHRPRIVVEVGCGASMLSRRALDACDHVEKWIVVEPSGVFAERARQSSGEDSRLFVVEGFFENLGLEVLRAAGSAADVVLISSLLHEVSHPASLLEAAQMVLSSSGLLHVNVPNASSLHRRLAKTMALIPDLTSPSDRNIALAQARVFNLESLLALLTESGFRAEDSGGHFLKPFSNRQMQSIGDVLTPAMLDGLSRLGRELPELASEIYVNARKMR